MRVKPLRWLVLSLLLVLGGGTWWLLATEAGLAWAWGRTEATLEGQLTAARVSGRLLGPLRVEGMRLRRPGMTLVADRLELDWQPGWLLTGRVALRRVVGQGISLELAAGGAVAARPPALVFPLALSVEGGVLRDFSLHGLQAAPLLIDEMRLDASWRGTRLLLAPFTARGPWGQLALDGHLATGPGRESDLTAQWTVTLEGAWPGLQPGTPLPLAGQGRLTGSYAEPRLTAQLSAPFAIGISGTLAWQQSPPRWQAEVELPPLALTSVRPNWPEISMTGQGRLTGVGAEIALEAAGTVTEARAGPWTFNGRAAYGSAGLRLEQVALWPKAGSGELVLDADWAGGEAAANLTLRWDGLRHPLLPGWHSHGHLTAVGRPEHYRGQLSLAAAREVLPPLHVSTYFDGNHEGVTLSNLSGQWLAGDWRGDATVGWRDGLDWHARLHVDKADPGLLDGRWPGRLGGEVESHGRWQGGRLAAAVPRLRLHGELAGRPLRLEGAGRLEERQAHIARLELRSGSARLTARGGAGAIWSLDWGLDAAQLGDLWPEATGSVNLRGRVTGPEREPRLWLDGKGSALAWAGTAMREAVVHADVDLAGIAPWQLDMRMAGLTRDEQGLERVQLRASGSAAQHDIVLEAHHARDGRATIAARGTWAASRWAGTLGGRLESSRAGTWQAAPAALEWGAAGGSLQSWCWRGQGDVCLALQEVEGRWQATGALAAVPLTLLEPWLPRSDLALSGSVGGAVTATGRQTVMTALTARLGVADGRLLYRLPDGTVESALRTLQLDMDGIAAAGLVAQLQVLAEDGGSAHARLALPGWLPGLPWSSDQRLQGRLDLKADRLDWLTYIEPNLLRPAGQLQAHLQLGGSVAAPALSGEFSLRDGGVLLPAAGIRLTDIHLAGRSSDGRTLTLTGAARSGPGQLTVNGQLVSEHFGHWRAALALKGERFELVRLVQARALVSPDLTVMLEQGRMEVTGQLAVPQADINLPRLPTVVEASPDEVILDAVAEEAALRRWRLLLDLRLVAGERVRLEGYGFSGRLAGAVTLRGETPGLTRAQGELNIHDGRYEAYGQNLVVERGRLLFVDSPPDNPGLDVRAVRPLPDPEQTVGVEVGGRLKDPRLRLFSVPVLEESETLAWLVLGRPLTATSRTEADALYRAAFALGGDRAARGIALQFGLDEVSLEQGRTDDEAAVVLGKYLSPRLYLQYAVGLWETANRLRLRYQLSSHWSLKMEQGGEQGGADLQYVIER